MYSFITYFLKSDPQTTEGQIVKIADEISGLVNDLFFYSLYIQQHITCIESYKVYISLLDILNNLKHSCNQNDTRTIKFYNLVNELINKTTVENKEKLEDFLIKEIEIQTQTSSCCAAILPTKVNFINPTKSNFDDVKETLYRIIHNDEVIKKNNKEGSEILKKKFVLII